MKLVDVAHVLRIGFALLLLVACAYLCFLSTLLLDMDNFRTEGSPAGTGMFVILLMAPLAALATGVSGVFLLIAGRWTGLPEADSVAPVVQPPPRREEVWQRHPGGARLGALIHGDFAVLRLHATGEDPGVHSQQTAYRGAPAATYPFLDAGGQLLQLPTAWTIPTALAVKALQHFEQTGERPPFIAWQPYAASESVTTAPGWHG